MRLDNNFEVVQKPCKNIIKRFEKAISF